MREEKGKTCRRRQENKEMSGERENVGVRKKCVREVRREEKMEGWRGGGEEGWRGGGRHERKERQ